MTRPVRRRPRGAKEGVEVAVRSFTAAPPEPVSRGLLGWLCLEIAGVLVVDGVALRRTRDRRLVLSFPVRHDTHGRQHPVVWPAGTAARRAIEAQVLAALPLVPEGRP